MGKFISLFAGVGGFDLGMEQAGHECVAQVEWDKNAAGVLKHRWPNVPLFCDVSKVSADDLPDADFITYGFPCQDLSVAGKREGLDGKRSGLFYEATRLIRELLGRGCGLRFAVAENVGGLFSADDGVALARCIRELLDSGACETGWRLVDSQYFGVAQRRKRVFIVSDFGGESVDEILAITESLPGYPAPSREAGKGTAGDATKGVGEGGHKLELPEVCATITGELAKHTNNQMVQNAESFFIPKAESKSEVLAVDFYNNSVNPNTSQTLSSAASDKNHIGGVIEQKETYCLQGGGETSQSSQGSGVNKDVAFTLNGLDKHGVAYEQEGIAFEPKSLDGPPRVTGDIKKVVSPSLNCMTGGGREPAVVSWNGDTTPKASEDVSVTLRSQQGGEGVGVAFQKSELRLKDKIELKQISPTLKAETKQGDTEVNVLQGGEGVGVAHGCDLYNCDITGDKSMTLKAAEGNPSVNLPTVLQEAKAFTASDRSNKATWEGDISGTINCQMNSESSNLQMGVRENLTVRRLTPIECERLQGFPDNWTAEKMELILEGNEWKATGKVVKQADGPRYKAMGNAVTVNVAEWIGKQIGKVLDK